MSDAADPQVEWIAVDWGTSNLRAWAMAGANPVGTRQSDQGMGGLQPDEFEPALYSLIDEWLPEGGRMPVLICGMAGARTGWTEAPYRAVPCPPLDARNAAIPPVRDPRLQVRILPGLSQATPPDVMRGEEAQIAGFLAQNPGYEGVICLPGTHSKWVRIRAGQVESFQTFMSGELFALLSTQSVLRLSIGAVEPSDTAYASAAATAARDPQALMRDLFSLRAGSLLNGVTGSETLGHLSGLIIGAEIGAARPIWQDSPVSIVGAPGISQLYARALTDQDASVQQFDGSELVLSGLIAAHHQLQDVMT